MQYFFYFFKIIEEKELFDIGFNLYGPGHLIWLAATVVACVLFSNWYKKLPEANRVKTKKFFAIAILVSEILKDLVLWLAGAPMIEYLPLHLCRFAMFGILIDAYGRWQHITGQMIAFALLNISLMECPVIHISSIGIVLKALQRQESYI